MKCFSSARYSMTALIVPQGDSTDEDEETGTPNGRYEYVQDADSGAIERTWIVDSDTNVSLPGVQPSLLSRNKRIKCVASAARIPTSEKYTADGVINIVDFVTLKFPSKETITRKDRVTDIRDKNGNLLWREEEFDSSPTVFDVQGISPVFDSFRNHIENSALLKRSQVQNG